MLQAYIRRLAWVLMRFGEDWFNPVWFRPSNLIGELTRPGVRAWLMNVLALTVFALLCMSAAAAPFAASIDVGAFIGMLDIEIYVTVALIALPAAKLIATWIKPKTIALLKHELIILWMCFDRKYEMPNSLRVIDMDLL